MYVCFLHDWLWPNDTNRTDRTKDERRSEGRSKTKGDRKADQPAPVFTKKENATLAQRIEILDWHHQNKQSQVKTAAHFDKIYPNLKLKQPIISDWIKNEQMWRERWAANQEIGREGQVKRAKQTEHPTVTEMLELWVAKAMQDGVRLTGEVIQQKWVHFADIEGILGDERLQLSDSWLASLKRRWVSSILVSSLLNADAREPANPTAAVKQEITKGLDLLETRGLLSCRNCLSIEDLLNPATENE